MKIILLENVHINRSRFFIADFEETIFLSPIVISDRVPAGQLLQGCWETLAEDNVLVRIGPSNGLVITHQPALVKAFARTKERQFGLDAPFGGRYQDIFKFGDSNRKGGN